MNVRDPFNLHRSPAFSILRGTATAAATHATKRLREAGEKAYESGKQAVEEMSFAVPQNTPSFSAPQRELENRVWGASGVTARSGGLHANGNGGGVMNNVQSRVEDFFEKSRGDLPMYKDKPYSYASSRRQRPIWKRKRTYGIAGLVILLLWFFFGGSSRSEEEEKKAKDTWSWLKSPEKSGPKVDWLDRREKVKDAFALSWDAYERYAWGMSHRRSSLDILLTVSTFRLR